MKQVKKIAVVLTLTDIPLSEDEKAREVAREMGRIEEHDRHRELDLAAEKARKDEQALQRERELATEKGRRQGLEEERTREKGKGGFGTGMKVAISLIVLGIILLVVAFLSLSVSVTNVTPGNSLPFTTTYGVSFPEGQTVTVGNVHINVLSYQNELISDIDGDRQKLVIGENRVVRERRAVITTLGAITLIDTVFEIDLKYNGERDNRAFFDMAIHTSRQVPDVLLRNLIPPEMDARPI